MNFVGSSTSAVWRQRMYGSLAGLGLYLLMYLAGWIKLNDVTLASLSISFALYFFALYLPREFRLRWALALADTITIGFLVQDTGGANSAFLMLIPVWFFGVSLANLVDGETAPIPYMMLMGAAAGLLGAWYNLNIVTVSILVLSLLAVGAGALTLALERRAARRDPLLTMLFNRASGLERLEELCMAGEVTSVAFVDLRDFKGFNDKLGHKTGDEILLEVAKRLVQSVRKSDLTVRMGGDEFLIASQHPDLQIRLEAVFALPIQTSKGELLVSGDIGSVSISRQEEIDAILERADALMYARKRAAKVLA